ncbi:MAG: hypothetical protein FJ295_12150 [Planctomycetes bacterium]|nr:hypothetical protein [Planctomycetota bacterium]
MAASRNSPVTDSPWFWACVFGTAALAALALAQPKFGKRQTQIEQQFQGRQFAQTGSPGGESSVAYSTPGQTIVGLSPIVWGVALVVAIAWGLFWRQLRYRLRLEKGQVPQ